MERWYDRKVDVLNIELKRKRYWKSVELPNGIMLDLSPDGDVIAIEILRASHIFSGDIRKVLDTARIAVADAS